MGEGDDAAVAPLPLLPVTSAGDGVVLAGSVAGAGLVVVVVPVELRLFQLAMALPLELMLTTRISDVPILRLADHRCARMKRHRQYSVKHRQTAEGEAVQPLPIIQRQTPKPPDTEITCPVT